MLLRTFTAIALLLCLSGRVLAYENPILGPINDPDCIMMDGLFRLIEPEGGAKSAHFNYRTSKDLVHWSDPVPILPQPPGVALWQGSYYRDTDGTLYLYYAAVDRAKAKTVHVARAQDFTGPFTDLGIVAGDAIDPYPLRDPTGQLWLYFKNDAPGQKGIWVQRMADAATPAAAPVEVLHPQPHTFEDHGYLSVEGPTVILRGGVYFLLYSGGPFGAASYAVGYAHATAPDGPFVRGAGNPILSKAASAQVYSPGVPTVVADGAGQSWLVYRQRVSAQSKSPRVLTIDRLDDGRAAEGILRARATSGTPEPDPVPLP
jgi:beta-xylosidase